MDFNNFVIFILCCSFCVKSSLCHASLRDPPSSSTNPRRLERAASHGTAALPSAASAKITDVPSIRRTSNATRASTRAVGRDEESNEVNISNESEPLGNSSLTITFWRPYFTYIRQVPSMLWSHFVEGVSLRSLIHLNLISIGMLSAAAFVSFLSSPESNELFERMQHMNLGTRVEEMARTVELAIDSYGKVDPEVCLRMAACTLGKQNRRESAGNAGNGSVTDSDGNNLGPGSNSSSIPSASSKEVPRDNPLFVTIQVLDKLLRLASKKEEEYHTVPFQSRGCQSASLPYAFSELRDRQRERACFG